MSFFYFPFSILNFMLYADLCNMYRFCILVLTTGCINRDVTTLSNASRTDFLQSLMPRFSHYQKKTYVRLVVTD